MTVIVDESIAAAVTDFILAVAYTVVLVRIYYGNKNKTLLIIVWLLFVSNLAATGTVVLGFKIHQNFMTTRCAYVVAGCLAIHTTTFSVAHYLLAKMYNSLTQKGSSLVQAGT